MISRVLLNKKEYDSPYIGEKIVNLLDKTFEILGPYDATVMEVSEEYIARPDLLAFDIYGDSMYADIICKINGISNPFELNEGMYLIIPSIDSLDNFVVIPTNIESKQYKPEPKKNTDRRKPSDATQGNTRFTIDELSKVIRY